MASNRTMLMLPGDGIGPEVMGEVRRVIDWMDKRRHVSAQIVGLGQRLERRRQQFIVRVAHDRAQRGIDLQEPRDGRDERHADR